ncbi:DUF2283 domain-containing protein [Arcanobacterium canis]|uniref:DUF2283 domain-containing protein n=1 Tax=Arcanobacterium canis TaxID=999183 RepID=A0ABY8FWX0_9ACTO|nr:DUF2283 domain-containing protein [Arcanobacterium canis]WFM83016.1 DUF2283 domain-containing protein [Arcanobacterium canis]
MHLTYDREADAAYITFGKSIEPNEASSQVSFIETPNGQTQVTIDVDSEGYLLGIEILSASAGLREDILNEACHL